MLPSPSGPVTSDVERRQLPPNGNKHVAPKLNFVVSTVAGIMVLAGAALGAALQLAAQQNAKFFPPVVVLLFVLFAGAVAFGGWLERIVSALMRDIAGQED